MFIQAVNLARSGRKAEARYLLEQLIKVDRTNEMAWLWYAECVETQDERAKALEACMRINPQAQRVRLRLSALRQTGRLPNDPGLTQPVFIGDEAEVRPVKASRSLSAADKWALSPDSSVFTVSPDAISTEEFNRVEERTEAFLVKNPDLKPVWRPLKEQDVVLEAWQQPLAVEQPVPVTTAEPGEEAELADPGDENARGSVFTLLLVTLMVALLVSAVIMLKVV